MWIKICGTTTLDDALMAAGYGADALGFIFAPSRRRVSLEAAGRISAGVPSGVARYGVFVDPALDEVIAAIESCGLTGVQLHRSRKHRTLEPRFSLRLREHITADGQNLGILHAIGWSKEPSPDSELESGLAEILGSRGRNADLDPATDALLVDPSNGTGAVFDWSAAHEDFLSAGRAVRMVVAGGLNAGNVAEAISILQPWGVDVASGVESSPGRKDRKRLEAFIRNARRATAKESEDRLAVAKDNI